MGTFVLGVLVGWLAEWLFFTFWVKKGSNSDSSNCDDLRTELNAKNREIAVLKTATTSKAASVGSSSAAATATTKKTTKTTVAKKEAVSPAEKAPVKKTPSKKATTAKKPATKKVATKKPTPKKVAEKPTTKKAAVKKASPAKKVKTSTTTTTKKTSGDDLTKLSGIGPSMAATMGELGITSYKKLAAMDDDILRDMLEESGARLNNNKEAMDSWNEQATLADKGDFAGLKKLQDNLK